MRKVFLDNLPKFISGTNKGKIDWKESIGYQVKFIYDDITDKVEIINYYRSKYNSFIDIKYNNNILSISSPNFLRCQLGSLLGKHLKKHKYHVGDIIKTKSGKIQILEQIRMTYGNVNRKGYKYKCLIDNYISCILESNLYKGRGCIICSGQQVLKGYNDLWTTHIEVAKMLKYPKRGYELSHGTDLLEVFICPNCGYEKYYRISDVVNKRFSCPRCSDGIPYPEKFMFNVLEQLLDKDFITQLSKTTLKWCKGYKYDFYINKINCIIETHGLQHYKEINYSWGSLDEIQENDKDKELLAKQNEISDDCYIIIDCRYSEMEWIKDNIMNSNLPNLLNFKESDIDWLKCHEAGCSSLVKKACDLWNSGLKNSTKIAEKLKIYRTTVVRYLKQGVELNWCNYDSKEEMIKRGKILGKKRSKEIIQFSINGEFIKQWESATEVQRQSNMLQSNISTACRNKRKSAYGFKWMYKEDYDQYIKDKNNNSNE